MANCTLLLTRPEASARRFAARLSDAAREKVDVVISPLLKIVPTDAVWPSKFEAVIFSSVNGVVCAGDGGVKAAYCVGTQTAQAAKQANWRVLETELTAKALVDLLVRKRVTGPLLHLAGRHRRGDIAGNLSKQGIETQVATLYDQQLLDLGAEAIDALRKTTIAPLFSPRTAGQFALQKADYRKVHVIALSASVADALGDDFAGTCSILPEPKADLMVKAVENLCLHPTIP